MFATSAQRLALLFAAAVFLCAAIAWPAFPVDETRYLTVAWEMRHGHWILPLLNGRPYSQKPPLLFWLINLLWTATGPCVWAARAVCFLFSVGVLILTRKLAKALFPARSGLYDIAPLLALASPLFLVFVSMIMFDQLLSFAVITGIYALWQAGQSRRPAPWMLLGLAFGLGVMAKGPVVLVDLLPPLLLAPFLWLSPTAGYTRTAWYGRGLISILIGAAIGLAWAIPAAVTGGAGYAHMIFLGQSTGRMVNAFAHAEPVWFYIPFALAYAAPWLFLPDLWRGGRMGEWRDAPQVRFLLSWLVPAFIIFSLISGKQMHYILPLVPGAAILAAYALDAAWARRPAKMSRPWFFFPYALGLAFMAAVPYLPFVRHNHKYQNLSQGVAYFENWPFILGIFVDAGFVWLTRRRPEGQVLALVFCSCLAFCLVTAEGGIHLFKFYDLAPLRAAVQPFNGHAVAVVAPYEGEVTFQTRLEQPPEILRKDADLGKWLAAHQGGVLVLKNRVTGPLPAGRVLTTQLFHGDQRFTVIAPLP